MKNERLDQLESMAREYLPTADDVQVAPLEYGKTPFAVYARVGVKVCWQPFHVSELWLACKIIANKLGISVTL